MRDAPHGADFRSGAETCDGRQTSHLQATLREPTRQRPFPRGCPREDRLPARRSHRCAPLAALVAPGALGRRPRPARGGGHVHPPGVAHRGAGSQRGGHRADHDRLLERRHDRARPSRRREPHQRPARGRPARRAARGPRRGGPRLLRPRRLLPQGHRPRHLEQRLRRRRPGRVDDHAAVREERVPHAGAHVQAQGEGAAARGQARDDGLEGPDPQRLPQHHLLRPRRLRHRGRVAAVLREVRQRPRPRSGRGARRDHPLARRLLPREQPREAPGPLDLRPRRHGREGLDHAGAEGGRRLPQVQGEAPGEPLRRPERLPARRGAHARSRTRASPRTSSTAADSA